VDKRSFPNWQYKGNPKFYHQTIIKPIKCKALSQEATYPLLSHHKNINDVMAHLISNEKLSLCSYFSFIHSQVRMTPFACGWHPLIIINKHEFLHICKPMQHFGWCELNVVPKCSMNSIWLPYMQILLIIELSIKPYPIGHCSFPSHL